MRVLRSTFRDLRQFVCLYVAVGGILPVKIPPLLRNPSVFYFTMAFLHFYSFQWGGNYDSIRLM